MQRITRVLATATAVVAAISVSSGIAAQAQAAGIASPTIVGSTQGLHLQSSVKNADGTVTSKWSDSSGDGIIYSGPADAQLIVAPQTATLVNGQQQHASGVSVTVPQLATSANAAVVAYAQSGRSVEADAARVGMSPAAAAALNAPLASTGVKPALAAGTILNEWCVTNYANGAKVYDTACVVRSLIQATGSNYYWYDSTLSTATDSQTGIHGLTSVTTFMTYGGSGSNVFNWVPNTPIKTSCSDYTFSITELGITLGSTNQICGGKIAVYDLNTNPNGSGGAKWSGLSSSISIQPIMAVHAPTGNQSSYLNIAVTWL